jgi:hypothetical protein
MTTLKTLFATRKTFLADRRADNVIDCPASLARADDKENFGAISIAHFSG